MTTKNEHAPKEHITVKIKLTLQDLIDATSTRAEIFIPIAENEGDPDIAILIKPDMYESSEDALKMYMDEYDDAFSDVTPSEMRALSAYATGNSLVGEIFQQLFNIMKPYVTYPDKPHHLTFIIVIDSYNFCAFDTNRLEYDGVESIFSPDHEMLKSAVVCSFPEHSKGFEIYNPYELSLDSERENDGTYAVVSDFYCDASSSYPVIQNVIVVKLQQ